MRYLIIGLGIYGANLARDLTEMGHEVIGADNNQLNVDNIKDYISTVYLIDSTEESALSVLPLRNVDVTIVAIGENFGASVKTVALLKKLGLKNIFARASDPLHEAILQGLQIQRILTPEQRAAMDLSHEMEMGTQVESMMIDDEYRILKFAAPKFFYGVAYQHLDLKKNYGLELIAATRPKGRANVLGINQNVMRVIDTADASMVVEKGDIITVYGTRKAFHELYRQLN